MCRIFLLSLIGIFISMGTLSGDKRIANDNVVIITGDTPDGLSTGPVSWDEITDSQLRAQWIFDEFWNDTYLMWELAFTRGCFPDNKAGEPLTVGHIHVLYADGVEYPNRGSRYNSAIRFPNDNISQITDYSATYGNVTNIFNWLANGHGYLPPMTEYDLLFCYTFNHGASSAGYSYLCLMDANMRDDDFAAKVAPINHWRRVFWMQQCYSGGLLIIYKAPKQ